MRIFFLITPLLFLSALTHAQSLQGKWKLVNESTCPEEEKIPGQYSHEPFSPTLKGIAFGGDHACEIESNHPTKDRSVVSRGLFYKVDGDQLYLLNKRTQTIISMLRIEKLSVDSLIYSDVNLPCNTRVFVRQP